jgi:hypothetical protein
LHAKAKAESGYRFYALYDNIANCPLFVPVPIEIRPEIGTLRAA